MEDEDGTLHKAACVAAALHKGVEIGMLKLTYEELTAEIYAVLKKSPHGEDLEVSKKCAWEVMQAETAKDQAKRE